jgi:hypothetical protein
MIKLEQALGNVLVNLVNPKNYKILCPWRNRKMQKIQNMLLPMKRRTVQAAIHCPWRHLSNELMMD